LEAKLEPEYEVLKAADAETGLLAALGQHPDLILVDIRMPEMDGYELVKELRRFASTRHIPVVMLTAVEDSSSIYKAQDLGVMDYLIKSQHLDDLPTLIKRYL
jgi:two-component system cell cycle response regulator